MKICCVKLCIYNTKADQFQLVVKQFINFSFAKRISSKKNWISHYNRLRHKHNLNMIKSNLPDVERKRDTFAYSIRSFYLFIWYTRFLIAVAVGVVWVVVINPLLQFYLLCTAKLLQFRVQKIIKVFARSNFNVLL